MPDIHVHRAHRLGMAKAREVASQWADEAERKYQMACTVREDDDHDVVEFARTGVSGTLRVAADRFELHARLGLLLGAFSNAIVAEIEKNLDALLGRAQAAPAQKPPAAPRRRR